MFFFVFTIDIDIREIPLICQKNFKLMKNNTDDIFLELFPVDDTLENWLHVINNCALYALLFVQHLNKLVWQILCRSFLKLIYVNLS